MKPDKTTLRLICPIKSGRLDSNQRPLRPERSALPGCATARKYIIPANRDNHFLVGWTGFEPATSCTPCKCATGLRHHPKISKFLLNLTGLQM